MTRHAVVNDFGQPELDRYLSCLYGLAPSPSFIEVRRRVARGMASTFIPIRKPELAAACIRKYGRTNDVFVGAAPRVQQRGRSSDVERLQAVWADCDTNEAIARLEKFDLRPSIVVRSGRGRHAYWLLDPPGIAASAGVQLNRRLALALESDPAVIDAARILRPPGTLNFKYGERCLVSLESCTPEPVELEELSAELPQIPSAIPRSLRPQRSRRSMRASRDPLNSICPSVYIPVLTGQQIGRDNKVFCVLHEERTPSLHIYDDHWYCFGCRRGGDIVALGAALYGLERHGEQYRELRRRLARDLLGIGNGA